MRESSDTPAMHEPTSPTLYARLGPAPFATLARELYRGLDGDARIRAMFPEDLSATSRSVADMREFLTQFFGGPADYSDRKGHPRLRARHMRFAIDQSARDAWLENALAALVVAVSEHSIPRDAETEIARYLVQASQFMINRG